ncbi:uncharacterized protein LOC126273384 [Schistocerca gregaria]|uniref:uncharacterized protein LOC126273384 n=1 Tax=Schistocerca gregaria TaxID=7010 RepID=UPI00211DE096|nr:uncharacterized protein LOC126273384 [Schistocerca gregaria]
MQSPTLSRLSLREAEQRFGIPRSTVKNRLSAKHSKNVGRSQLFTDEEQLSFQHHLIKLCDFGFPIYELDFRMAVKSYLSKKGDNIPLFKNNLPVYEWTKYFLKCHNELSVRMSSNIKKVIVQISETDLNSYMDNLSDAVKEVPLSRIWNYDDTKLCDDSGSKKVICKQGAKYVENICNFSKSSTSIIFCGNAEGRYLPAYVVYEADHSWSTWTENGPQHTRYNRTKSGWFDGVTFEDWFLSHFLPAVKHEELPVVIIGDNPSSHISQQLLRVCEEMQLGLCVYHLTPVISHNHWMLLLCSNEQTIADLEEVERVQVQLQVYYSA